MNKSYELAEEGKKGNLICEFKTFYDDTVYELRECPVNKNIYMVWWDKSIFGGSVGDYTCYPKFVVEENFADKAWIVVGNKCKRAILK